jgi:hypothetical protein
LLNIVRPNRHGGVDYHRGPLPLVPPAVHQLRIDKSDGTRGVRVWVDDLDGLLGLVEMGVIEVHPWGATVDDIERPDLLAFNLKPGDGLDWGFVVETAQRLRGLLAAEDLDCWPKTTGDDSLHVMAPIEPTMTWEAVREFAKKIAERLDATAPDRYTPVSSDQSHREGPDRLPAKRARQHGGRRLLAARPAWLSDRRSDQLARSRTRHPLRQLCDDQAPVFRATPRKIAGAPCRASGGPGMLGACL